MSRPTASQPIGSLTEPTTGGRLSPGRARKLDRDLVALAAHRHWSAREIRDYLITRSQT